MRDKAQRKENKQNENVLKKVRPLFYKKSE